METKQSEFEISYYKNLLSESESFTNEVRQKITELEKARQKIEN
jgi:hypothetical protein